CSLGRCRPGVNDCLYLLSPFCDTYDTMQSFDALVLSLPTRNSTLRMRLWRALKDAGSGVLRDGVYVVPAGKAPLGQLEADIKSNGGFAMTVELTPRTAQQ